MYTGNYWILKYTKEVYTDNNCILKYWLVQALGHELCNTHSWTSECTEYLVLAQSDICKQAPKKLLAAPFVTPAEKKSIGAIIRIGREIQCLPYARFFHSKTLKFVEEEKNILLV